MIFDGGRDHVAAVVSACGSSARACRSERSSSEPAFVPKPVTT